MLAYRLTDFLSCRTIAVSTAAAERYVRLKAFSAGKSLVVTNGIDTTEFAPSLERRARMRAEMGAGSEFIWLTAGRIVPAKDYPNLLRAFARVRAAYSETRLWVAGNGDVDELSDLIVFADELNLRGQVRWLGLRRDMAALLDAADGFLLASAWEGMPLAAGEAMAMEKPVAATDVGGVRELMGETGFIVPAKSPEALAGAMLEWMRTTNEARRALGRAGRERIMAYFSMDAKVVEWEALYRAVLEKTIDLR
jgi:glycosyltransferase involved in cell wall biosynthesis